MAGQTVRYVIQATDALYPMLVRDERAAMGLERQLAGVNSQIRGVAAAIGVGFGAYAFVKLGQDIIETTTKLESYRNLIKFASSDMLEAAKNQDVVTNSVKDFKLPLMETYEEYSQLMAMVKNTPAEGDKARAMFSDLAETLTVLHLPAERVQTTLMNLGKMLEEGAMPARYLRSFTIALPGSMSALAKETGKSMQELNEMMRTGGALGLNPYDLLPKVLKDIKDAYHEHLPEALKSYLSQTNDLHTAWLLFQEDIGNILKPEIISLFDTLKEGISWLKEHEHTIINWGKIIKDIAEIYIIYKASVAAINLVNATQLAFMQGYTSVAATNVTAIESQTVAYNGLTAAIERLNYVQNASSASFIANAEGQLLANTAGNRYIVSAETQALAGAVGAGASGALTSAGLISMLNTAVLSVSVVAIGAAVLDNLARVIMPYSNVYKDVDNENYGTKYARENITQAGNLDKYGLPKYNPNWIPPWEQKKIDQHKAEMAKAQKGAIVPKEDRITGQRVITYNITIKEMNGQKITTQQNGTSSTNVKLAAEQLAQMLESVVNDSQLHGNE